MASSVGFLELQLHWLHVLRPEREAELAELSAGLELERPPCRREWMMARAEVLRTQLEMEAPLRERLRNLVGEGDSQGA